MSWYFPGESSGTRKWRRRFGLPVVGSLVLGIVDIWLLVAISGRIGVLPVWLFVIAEALVGGWLIQRRWRDAKRRLGEARNGKINLDQPAKPIAQVVDTGLVVAGGAALIFPGPITALLGISCLIPFTRRLPAGILQRSIERQLSDVLSRGGMRATARPDPANGMVVEGEVVDDPPRGGQASERPVIVRRRSTER